MKKCKTEPKEVINQLTALRDTLSNVNKIADFIGALYDYHRALTFDLKKAFPLPKEIQEHNSSQENEKYWNKQLARIFKEDYHTIEMTGNKAVVIIKNIKDLSQAIDRHMIITAAAFPYLVSFWTSKI